MPTPSTAAITVQSPRSPLATSAGAATPAPSSPTVRNSIRTMNTRVRSS